MTGGEGRTLIDKSFLLLFFKKEDFPCLFQPKTRSRGSVVSVDDLDLDEAWAVGGIGELGGGGGLGNSVDDPTQDAVAGFGA